jgi:hypothetical protein
MTESLSILWPPRDNSVSVQCALPCLQSAMDRVPRLKVIFVARIWENWASSEQCPWSFVESLGKQVYHLAPSPARTASHAYTATPTTNLLIRGFDHSQCSTGWDTSFFGRGTLFFSDALHVPQSTETPTYDSIPMIGLLMLAFSFRLKHGFTKNPTHMSLPATWWLLLTLHRGGFRASAEMTILSADTTANPKSVQHNTSTDFECWRAVIRTTSSSHRRSQNACL